MPPLSVTNAPLPNQQDAIQVQQARGSAPASLQNARTGHSAGRVLARIALAMLTLGISEGIRAIVKLVRAAQPEETPPPRVNARPARAEIQPAPQAEAPLSLPEVVEVGRIAIAEGFTLEEFMENCAGMPEADLQFVRNALAEGTSTEGQARPALPEHLQDAVQTARDVMQAAGLSLDEVMAQMAHLSAADAALVRAELAPAQTATPQPDLAAGIAVRSQADLIAFIRAIARAQLGQAVPVGQATTSTGLPATLHHYDGIVFRADGRPFWKIRLAGGMHSRNNLSKAENLLEAQGLAYDKGAGATGQSGVSTAKKIEGAIAYYTRGAFYIIDTRQLGNGRYAYDMEANLHSTNYPRAHEVGGEVNVTDIPMRAIMGCIQLDTTDLAILCDEPSNDAKITLLLQFIERNASVVKFNPQYNPR